MTDKDTTNKSKRVDLNRLVIPNPCSADWESMTGDERVKSCSQCDCRVFNLSEMTQDEATDLVENRTERICGRVHRRADGTIVTKDFAAKDDTRMRRRPFQFSIAKLLVLMTGAAGICSAVPIIGPPIAGAVHRWFAPATPVKTAPMVVMGAMIEMGDVEMLAPEEVREFFAEP